MQVKKQEMLTALEKVRPGLATNEHIEQSTSFAFMKDKVVTFNDEISISYPIKCGVNGAVKAEELYALLSKIEPKKDELLEIEQEEHEVQIRGKRTTAGIRLQSEIRLPLNEVDYITEKWEKAPLDLSDALKLAMFSASKDMTRPILTCLSITKNAVYSSDGYRATKVLLGTHARKEFLIPATIAMELIKHPFTKYQIQENWGHFLCKDNTLFSFRTISGEFPSKSIDDTLNFTGQTIQFPSKMSEALHRAEIFSKKKERLDETVKIIIKGKRIEIRGEGEYGWLKEKMSLTKPISENVEFQINPSFLCDVLQRTNTCLIGKARVKFTSDVFFHVTALTV